MNPFFKTTGTLLAGLGGVAAILMVVGYAIVNSFLSEVRLYGLVEFPLLFYKGAVIIYIGDIIRAYWENIEFIIVPIIILFLPFVPKPRASAAHLRRFFWSHGLFLSNISIFIVLIVALMIQNNPTATVSGPWTSDYLKIFFYFVIVPLPLAIFCYLARVHNIIIVQGVVDMRRGIQFIFFLLLIVVIPLCYGTSFFDLDLYRVTSVNVSKDAEFHIQDGPLSKPVYLMGHTSGREVFFDTTHSPIRRVVVEKKHIKSITLYDDRSHKNTLRKLFKQYDKALLTPRAAEDAASAISDASDLLMEDATPASIPAEFNVFSSETSGKTEK